MSWLPMFGRFSTKGPQFSGRLGPQNFVRHFHVIGNKSVVNERNQLVGHMITHRADSNSPLNEAPEARVNRSMKQLGMKLPESFFFRPLFIAGGQQSVVIPPSSKGLNPQIQMAGHVSGFVAEFEMDETGGVVYKIHEGTVTSKRPGASDASLGSAATVPVGQSTLSGGVRKQAEFETTAECLEGIFTSKDKSEACEKNCSLEFISVVPLDRMFDSTGKPMTIEEIESNLETEKTRNIYDTLSDACGHAVSHVYSGRLEARIGVSSQTAYNTLMNNMLSDDDRASFNNAAAELGINESGFERGQVYRATQEEEARKKSGI